MLKYVASFIAADLLVTGASVTAIAGEACYAVPVSAAAAVAPKVEAKGARTKSAQLKFTVQGIFCADCVTHIRNGLKKVKGFQSVQVELSTGRGTVSFDPTLAKKDQLLKAISDPGYKVTWL